MQQYTEFGETILAKEANVQEEQWMGRGERKVEREQELLAGKFEI